MVRYLKLYIFLFLIFSGCETQVEVYRDLDSKELSVIKDKLHKLEIGYREKKTGDEGYSIFIPPAEGAKLVSFLSEFDIKETRLKVPEIVVPGSNLDKALTEKLLARELERTIASFVNGVTSKVLINKNKVTVIIYLKTKPDMLLMDNVKGVVRDYLALEEDPTILIKELKIEGSMNKDLKELVQGSKVYLEADEATRIKMKFLFILSTIFILGLGLGVVFAYQFILRKYEILRRDT